MAQPRDYETEAVIIKKTKLGEADRILTLYTPHLGKIRAVAKGIRRPKARLAGHLELLTHSTVTLVRGRNLDTISGSQTISSFLNLKSDLELSAYALYLCELVEQFTVEASPNYPLFQLLLETMQALAETADRELLLRYFELRLLNETGYRPQLHQCLVCHQPVAPETNYFNPYLGGVLCPECRAGQSFGLAVSVNALKVLRFLQDNDYNTVSRLHVGRELHRELETVTRGYLKYLLERDIKSADWLDTVREQLKVIGLGTG